VDALPEGSPPPRSAPPRAFARLFPPETPGWRGRVTRSFLQLLARWESLGVDEAALEIERLGLARPDARRLARSLVGEGRGRRIREGLSLDVFPKGIPKGLLDTVLKQAAIEVQGETDAPVTTDIHRLIRLPGSLHGGTGFRVVPIPRDGLDAFDPWRDARLPAPADERRTVELLETVSYPFADKPVSAPSGEKLTLPTPEALFLVLRGEARLPPGPG
jgi:DNA primase small subunit